MWKAAFLGVGCLIASSSAGFAETSSPPSTTDARPKLSALVVEADDVFAKAKTMVDRNPESEDEADHLAQTLDAPWSREEMAFQQALLRMTDNGQQMRYPNDVAEGLIRLGQFDNFVFQAVGFAYDCRTTQAHFTLNLARQMLDHARAAADGHPAPDWSPEDLDGPEDASKCRASVRSPEERLAPFQKRG
jgi:hypothetical protein